VIRDPADWARDWGWVSRQRAVNAARKIDAVANAIEGALDDEGADLWVGALRKISRDIAPSQVPAERKRLAREKKEKT
jgi:hypothetical protein